MRVAIQVQSFAGFGQEVDDLGELDVQQGRQLVARQYKSVEIDCRGEEVGTEVARSVTNRVTFHQRTLYEVRRRQRSSGGHATPRTYASMLPAQLILSPPGRSAYRVMSRPTVGPWWPHRHFAKLTRTLSPLMTPPQRPAIDVSKNAARDSISPPSASSNCSPTVSNGSMMTHGEM